MGFGSYDESEQETGNEDRGQEGETITNQIKGESYRGSETTTDESTEDMMEHL